jgi:hypothetical protein
MANSSNISEGILAGIGGGTQRSEKVMQSTFPVRYGRGKGCSCYA